MKSVTVEISGDNYAVVDHATTSLIRDLSESNVEISPANASGERDGGVIALVIAFLGGMASIAQVAAIVHAMSRRKGVRVIIVDHSGSRVQIGSDDSAEKVRELIEQLNSDP